LGRPTTIRRNHGRAGWRSLNRATRPRRFRSFSLFLSAADHDDHMKYKTRKRYETLGELRFLTFSCYHHLPLFNNDAIKDECVRALDDARKRTNYRIIAWVIMPNHVHLLVAPSLPQCPVPSFLTYLKAPFAKKVLDRWRKLEAPILRRLTDRHGKLHFWQVGGGYDRNIDSEDEYDEKFDYIHLNARRAGLVDDPVDWRWSSLPWYLGKPSVLPLD